ncbi:MAG: serine/threonine-protein kinase [Thermoguttaceae bacterium]|nr:serine/threonine-protein kinase [Thermoguttaceae bacterium]
MSESLPSSIGPFSITRILGRGGMGVVYEGVDHGGQRAAIKTILAHYASEPSIRKRFEAEIDALMRLNHPNIVRILGYGTSDNGDLFYAMEMLDGMDLEHAVPRGRTILWMAAVKLVLEICKGLKIAHDRGIIHRDLKPANVLCTTDGKVRLTDFGIARIFGSENETVAGSVLGTAEYMSPEQAGSGQVDARTDIYAVGGILYRLVAGRPPLIGRNVTELLQKQREIVPDPLSTYTLALPPELDQLVNDLLEKNPTKRPPNMMALTRRLQGILEDYEQTDFPPFHLGELGPSPIVMPSGQSLSSANSSDKSDSAELDSAAIPQSLPKAGRPVNLYSGIPEDTTQYGTIAAADSKNIAEKPTCFSYESNAADAHQRNDSDETDSTCDHGGIVSETLPTVSSTTPIEQNRAEPVSENSSEMESVGKSRGESVEGISGDHMFPWITRAKTAADDLYGLAVPDVKQDSTSQTVDHQTVWLGNLDARTHGFGVQNEKISTSSSSTRPSKAAELESTPEGIASFAMLENNSNQANFHTSSADLPFQDAATACENGETRYVAELNGLECGKSNQKRYNVVRDEDRDRLALAEETVEPTPVWRMPQTWILLSVLMVVLGGIVWFFQPVTADQLAKRIDTLLREPTESGVNIEAEQPIRDFLAEFPDDARANAMREQLGTIELFQLERRLEWRTRTTAMRGVASGERAMTPLEHEYLKAVTLAKEDPVKGIKRFDALVTLYAACEGVKDGNGQCYELLKRQRDKYKASLQTQIDFEKTELERLFEPLPALVKTDAEATAKQFAAIVELYGNRPWAKERIAAMRGLLQETKKNVDAEAAHVTTDHTASKTTDAAQPESKNAPDAEDAHP